VIDNPKMRVQEIKWVKAGDLKPHPMNWREHPEHQRKALRGVLQEIGFTGVLLAVERDGELLLVDGHLRRDEAPDLQVPVAILDLNDEEAEKALVTIDPIAAMAQADKSTLFDLLGRMEFQDQNINGMLEALANDSYQALVPFQAMEGDFPDLAEFKSFDEDITVDYKCPSCQYEWSGKPK
jgi:hypothetical protein